MKIRTGFVSNSSSSSFICEICGEAASGFDASPEDVGMIQCENEHIFCEDEALEDHEKNEEGFILDKYCPICNFLEASHSDLSRYFEKNTNITRNEIFEEVKKINKRRKKLKDNEYTEAVCQQQGTTVQKVVADLKEKYKTYGSFLDSLKG